jgi:hypothetical protein
LLILFLILSIFFSYFFFYKYGNYPIIKNGSVESPIQRMETTLLYFHGTAYSLQTVRPETPGNKSERYLLELRELNSNKLVLSLNCDCGLSDALVYKDNLYIFTSKNIQGKWGNTIYLYKVNNKFTLETSEAIYTDYNGSIYNIAVTEKNGKFYLLYESDDNRLAKFSFKFLLLDGKRIKYLGNFPLESYKGAPYFKYLNDYFYVLYAQHPSIKNKDKYITSIARSKNLKDWTFSDIPFLSPSFFELPCNSDVSIIELNNNVLIYYAEADQKNISILKAATYEGSLNNLFEFYF